MKIIFLDIDGVLNSTRSFIATNRGEAEQRWSNDDWLFSRERLTLDPIAVGLLNSLVKNTGANIVVSSSHRKFFRPAGVLLLRELQDYIQNLGVVQPVLDATPVMHNRPRGVEIDAWMENRRIEKYVILDDSSDMLEHQRDNFVWTDCHEGLSFQDYIKANKILGHEFQTDILQQLIV